MASLLDLSADVPERLLGQRAEVPAVQAQLVPLVGAGDQPVDVLVVGGVVPPFRAVDEALDLIGRHKRSNDEGERSQRVWDQLARLMRQCILFQSPYNLGFSQLDVPAEIMDE